MNGCRTSTSATSRPEPPILYDFINTSESIHEKNPRLLRGGSFNYLPAVVRSAYRGRVAPSVRDTTTSVSAPPGLTTDLTLYLYHFRLLILDMNIL